MNTKTLTNMFPEVEGYKTRRGADGKLAKAMGFLTENNVLHLTMQRPDGTYLPVAILGEKNEWCAGPLAGSGICVTRA